MRRKLNENSIEFVMGPSYMEDDVRTATNKSGFCAAHMNEMYQKPNRLGLALMTHTHLMEVNRVLDSKLKNAIGVKKKLFGGKKGSASAAAAEYLKSLENSCYICARTDDIFDRYVDTYFHLWKKDSQMKNLTEACAGFCFNHFAMLLDAGEKKLSSSEFNDFLQTVVQLQLNGLRELEGDLGWFIDKFDYRFVNEPWKNSKDALIRALKKISSVTVQ